MNNPETITYQVIGDSQMRVIIEEAEKRGYQKRKQEEEAMGLKDLAKFFGKSQETIIRWRKEPNFPRPKMIGNTPVWTKSKIVEWLNS